MKVDLSTELAGKFEVLRLVCLSRRERWMALNCASAAPCMVSRLLEQLQPFSALAVLELGKSPELRRPARLLTPPEPVTAAAEIPDSPPLFFVWRKIRHRVVKADGPERILGEWWVSDVDIGMQRDYYRDFAMRLPIRADVGGCMVWGRHELRRTAGHDASGPLNRMRTRWTTTVGVTRTKW
jgi:hypothetical protein